MVVPHVEAEDDAEDVAEHVCCTRPQQPRLRAIRGNSNQTEYPFKVRVRHACVYPLNVTRPS